MTSLFLARMCWWCMMMLMLPGGPNGLTKSLKEVIVKSSKKIDMIRPGKLGDCEERFRGRGTTMANGLMAEADQKRLAAEKILVMSIRRHHFSYGTSSRTILALRLRTWNQWISCVLRGRNAERAFRPKSNERCTWQWFQLLTYVVQTKPSRALIVSF